MRPRTLEDSIRRLLRPAPRVELRTTKPGPKKPATIQPRARKKKRRR